MRVVEQKREAAAIPPQLAKAADERGIGPFMHDHHIRIGQSVKLAAIGVVLGVQRM